VDAGQNVTLTCEIIGYPVKPYVEWKIGGEIPERLTNSSEFLVLFYNTSLTKFTSTLTIRSASKKHNGEFICDASHFNLMEGVKVVVRSKF